MSQHEGWPAHGVARTGMRAEQVKEEKLDYISLSANESN